MAPNFCPNCGERVDSHEQIDCAQCGHDFDADELDQDDDDLFDDDNELDEDDDDLFGDDDEEEGFENRAAEPVRPLAPASTSAQLPSGEESKWWHPVVVTLRWIAFIPAGFLGGALVGIIAYFFFGASAWMMALPFDSPWSRLIVAGVGGYTSVFIAAHTAPIKNKAVPAIVMAVLMFMLYGVSIVVNIGDREWFLIVQCVVGVVAVAGSMYQQIEETRT